MAPMRTPFSAADFRTADTSAPPFGKSHSTWTATLGQQPVIRCTAPASAIFSAVVVAAAGWMNFPNLVPVLAKPQDGNSMVKASSAAPAWSVCRVVIIAYKCNTVLETGQEACPT